MSPIFPIILTSIRSRPTMSWTSLTSLVSSGTRTSAGHASLFTRPSRALLNSPARSPRRRRLKRHRLQLLRTGCAHFTMSFLLSLFQWLLPPYFVILCPLRALGLSGTASGRVGAGARREDDNPCNLPLLSFHSNSLLSFLFRGWPRYSLVELTH